MAADDMSERNFQVDDIEEFREDIAITSTLLAQNLSIVQTHEYNVEIFIDLVKEEPCLWNTAFPYEKIKRKRRIPWLILKNTSIFHRLNHLRKVTSLLKAAIFVFKFGALFPRARHCTEWKCT